MSLGTARGCAVLLNGNFPFTSDYACIAKGEVPWSIRTGSKALPLRQKGK
jgi:hypothetical protein